MPGKTFTGKVTEIGNSPIAGHRATSASQATNFKVTVTVDGEIPDVRPGFTCTAEITTATRGAVHRGPDPGDHRPRDGRRREGQHRPRRRSRRAGKRRRRPPCRRSELKPGQERKELEGVFVVQDNKAVFVPVKTGIAGEKYFEVLSRREGRRPGHRRAVRSVRELADGAAVKVEAATTRRRQHKS